MIIQNGNYTVNNIKKFEGITFLDNKYLEESFEFAWDMSFGKVGMHRNHRSGGMRRRKNGEIFLNVFQGKLAEFAVYQEMNRRCLLVDYPDLGRYGIGQWDSSDFEIGGMAISIKSTKHYGNLLLLETKDWDHEGLYIPNRGTSHEKYDFFILVRLKLDLEKKMKINRLLYSEICDKTLLRSLISNAEIEFDMPGFISYEVLKDIISRKQIIPQGSSLNGSVKMDASNYYIETGKLIDMEHLYDDFIWNRNLFSFWELISIFR